MLHFAPEPAIAKVVKPLAGEYQTADLYAPDVDLKLNIEAIDLADKSVDALICSHVLEHVDDRLALPELYRILSAGGFAVLMVPMVDGWPCTYENSAIASPGDRQIHFGRHNHVRFYGADVRDRIRAAGFALSEITAVEPYVSRHSLERGSKIFIARKN